MRTLANGIRSPEAEPPRRLARAAQRASDAQCIAADGCNNALEPEHIWFGIVFLACLGGHVV
jgi:hypothetical protein